MTPQVKKIMTNIAIGALILGVVIAGYFVFFKKTDTTTVAVTAPTIGIEQAVAVSTNISRTKSELNELKKAVATSVEVFSSREFRSLQDFSQQVPEEPIGRDNPFMATSWKVKMIAEEAAISKKTASTGAGVVSIPSVVVTPSVTSTVSETTASVTTGI